VPVLAGKISAGSGTKRAHQRPSNHRRPGYARARQRGARPLRPGIR